VQQNISSTFHGSVAAEVILPVDRKEPILAAFSVSLLEFEQSHFHHSRPQTTQCKQIQK
jgi:hypothetical protein